MSRIVSMRQVLERAYERENYGVGPCMINDLPIIRAHNQRRHQELMDRDEAEQLARAVADLSDELAQL